MSKSTFKRYRVSVDCRFGNNIVRSWYSPQDFTNKAKNDELALYMKHDYRAVPSEVWIGATYNNAPIVALYVFMVGKESDFIIFTRNE